VSSPDVPGKFPVEGPRAGRRVGGSVRRQRQSRRARPAAPPRATSRTCGFATRPRARPPLPVEEPKSRRWWPARRKRRSKRPRRRPPIETDGRSGTRSAEGARTMRGVAFEANSRPPSPRPGANRDAAGHALVTGNGHARGRLVPTVARTGAIRMSDRRVEETTGKTRKFSSRVVPPPTVVGPRRRTRPSYSSPGWVVHRLH